MMSVEDTGGDSGDRDGLKWIAIVAAMVLAIPIMAIAFPIVIVLIGEAPWLLAMFAVMTFVFLAWAGVRSGVLAKDDRDEPAETDPLTTLQDRYAAGELSEAEFERRLERILESDEEVRRAAEGIETTGGRPRERAGREPATERE